tara:strand:- start:580 stop:993 length:414 start_codon:yes stop_codon:yes gene_type:complete
MKKVHEDIFTIYYENTDSSGFTYHTSYLSFAERARSNMISNDFPELIEMLKKNSKFFVVKQIKIKFFKPSYLFDKLKVITFFDKNSFTSLNLIQKIQKEGIDISQIHVQLVWIDGKNKKPTKIPADIISRFKSVEVV